MSWKNICCGDSAPTTRSQHFTDKLNWHSRASFLTWCSDDRVGRSWAHLLSVKWKQQLHIENCLWEQPEDQQNRFSTTKDINKTTLRYIGEASTQSSQEPPYITLYAVTHKQKGNHNCGRTHTPKRERNLSPSWGTCPRKRMPCAIWLWKPMQLTSERAKEL